MVLTHLIAASLAARLAAGYLVTPPGTPFPGTVSDCSGWVEGTTGITCAEVEEVVGITAAEFDDWVREIFSSPFCNTHFKRELRVRH
jgi:hypothetical protein